jgi:hypothetical protein
MIDNRCAARKGGRLVRLAATAAVFLALAPAARAQGLFNFFGGGPDPYDIERRLDASGYTLTGPLMRRGNVYLADVVAGRHDYERLIIDAQTGRIVQRFRNRPRWMDDQAETWGQPPRPPGDVDLPPPRDLFAREEPNTDLGDKPKAKPKHKTTPAPVASAPPASAQASEPTPASTPTSAPVAATPPSPTPSPAAASAAPAASPSPAETTAKSEDAPAAQSSPAPTPTMSAAAPTTAVAAKSAEPSEPRKKAVNDLPVTPLD